jgi:UDP-N-acetyl-2-amino-2-deoxyglucuronate dehydrogenase
MRRFALVGAAGFVAPRHMRAIKETGNDLVAAFDPNDSVGVIDSYFPDAHFFTEFERFDRHIDKLRRQGNAVAFVSICSPNYLHDAHVRFALRSGAEAICEKPLVINPWNLDGLAEIERETGRHIYNVLQFRLHPAIQALRKRVLEAPADRVFEIELTYLSTRGRWYGVSWKGDRQKSGGITLNIGVHFFDILGWIFGPTLENVVHINRDDVTAGYLRLERARVRWFLSTSADYLPKENQENGKRIVRRLLVDGEDVEFSDSRGEYHVAAYAEIMAGRGLGVADARPAIETVYHIRNAAPVGPTNDSHPFCAMVPA